VRLVYFAQLVETVGRTSEEVALPVHVDDVRALLRWLRERGDPWEETLAEDRVQVLRNRSIVDLRTPVDDHDEIALVPARR
jgi:molybdopterin converting factor small subunit